ncbi:Phosphoserine phosphatase [Lachnospiraceae bacterium XBB2008]|nr:Phosphoserine phosphatase [Lachnospiraceae bacterium XBB2008]
MSRLCLVDFDDTLIRTDSLKSIMNSEHWLCSPSLFAAGVKLFFCRALHKGETSARNHFKEGMLRRYYKLPEERVAKYAAGLKAQLNTAVVDKIKAENYDRIIVVSASEEKLIRRVLEGAFDGFDVIANSLEEGVEFRTCYGAEKVRRLAEYMPDYADRDIEVYTDSMSDKPLMEIAKRSYLVKDKELTEVTL